MTLGKFILKGKIPFPCEDLMKWAQWFETADRTITETRIGNIKISTVFLGLNHQFGKGKPLLFETMVFGGKLNGEMNRYSTWEEAEKGHKNIVKKVKEKQ